jgi:OmcA/MtrC family decaheme c-type cytochrome
MNNPTMAGCGSCHDRTWFGNPNQTPAGYTNHPYDFEQINDSQCASCHQPSGVGRVSITEAHKVPQESAAAPGLDVQIDAVHANPEDGTLAVTITAKYGDGSPITAVTTDPVLQRLGFVVAWPATDYQTSISESIRGSSPMKGTLDSPTSDTGTYTYTFSNKLPTGTTDTFGIALTGRVTFEFNGEEFEQGIKANGLTFFTVDGSKAAPVPRRAVVDDAKCNKCHADLRAHGEQRVGVGLCVMCHRPNASTEEGDSAVTINLKDMLHRFHTGENLENPYAIGSFNANEVRFPGDRRKCQICHVPNAELVPLPDGTLPTVVTLDDTVVSEAQPTRAACTSCHDGLLPNVHAILATSPPPDNVETCEVCHATDAAFAVPVVHKIEP